jgi:hypothetical protein
MDWIVAHWQIALIITVYVLVNVAPRPHPDEQTGLMRFLWTVLDRFSVLTAKQVPGKVKWLLAASPKDASGTTSGKGKDTP